MKTLVSLLLVIACATLFAGCAAYPNLVADHWVHDGHYGVATTHYEATNITRVGDGFHIGTYTGAITVMGGYGVSDTIQGLTITPNAAPAKP